MNSLPQQGESGDSSPKGAPDSVAGDALGSGQRTIPSEDIFCGHREVTILHGGETYRLLHTRNGKLILQK